MAEVARAGIRIHFDVVGSGEPVLLLHGGAASSEFWRRAGYLAAFARDHRILLLDFRGHGASSRPHRESLYGLRFDVDDTVAALDAAGISSATVCGWSWGGTAGLALAALHPERVRSVLAISASGRHGRFSDVPADLSYFVRAADRVDTEGIDWLAKDIAQAGGRVWLREVVLQNDPVAMAAWFRGQSLAGPIGCSLADIIRPPVLFMPGELEMTAMAFPRPLLPPHARLEVIPNATHVQAFLSVDVVVPALRRLMHDARFDPRARDATPRTARLT